MVLGAYTRANVFADFAVGRLVFDSRSDLLIPTSFDRFRARCFTPFFLRTGSKVARLAAPPLLLFGAFFLRFFLAFNSAHLSPLRSELYKLNSVEYGSSVN